MRFKEWEVEISNTNKGEEKAAPVPAEQFVGSLNMYRFVFSFRRNVLCSILHDAFLWNARQHNAVLCYLQNVPLEQGIEHANSRRVNHFVAIVLYGTGIYLPGFDRWRGRTRTALVFYIL